MSAAVAEAASFIDKWRRDWPEWGIARVFVPPAQRELAEAWFSLLREWTEAATTAEPAPGLAKLAWWQEELRGWAKGARRHPLGAVLQHRQADWAALADALPLLARREEGGDADALTRLASVIEGCERGLFAEDREGRAAVAQALGEALGAASADSAERAGGGTRPRRIINALLAERRRRGQSVAPWATLRCAWRAARD
ncbi:phytoene/squalene synthase family protein [Luteimonas sp. e5]